MASIDVDGLVRRDHFAVKPATCSARVCAGQPLFMQKKRRTTSRKTTGRPAIAASASRR
nr:hypothetical protein [Nocardia farcinica]